MRVIEVIIIAIGYFLLKRQPNKNDIMFFFNANDKENKLQKFSLDLLFLLGFKERPKALKVFAANKRLLLLLQARFLHTLSVHPYI